MTRRRSETRTIQVWPGGASYEYRGDPDGPTNQRSLRAGHYSARVRCPGGCHRTWIEDGALYMQGSAAPLSSVFVHITEDPRAGRHCVGDPLNYPERVSLCQLCKGEGYIANPVKNPWRKGTRDEWRAIRIELRAELYWSRDGLGCDSALVDDLIGTANRGELSRTSETRQLGEGFSYDQIRNLYADPADWTEEQCRAYAEEHGVDLPEPDQYDEDNPQTLDDLRDACSAYAHENPAEVYEWWRVSSWLCEELHAIGEVTIDNGYGHWWGRTCTGQSLLMDGTLQQVAARHEREEA